MSGLTGTLPMKRANPNNYQHLAQHLPVKLKTTVIFNQLRSSMGMLLQKGQVVKAGCFIAMRERAYFVTSSPEGEALPDEGLKVVHESGVYDIQVPEHAPEAEEQIQRIRSLGIKLFECHGRLVPGLSFLNIPPENPNLFKVGTKVYFGGAPMGTNQLTFHKGIISLEERSPIRKACGVKDEAASSEAASVETDLSELPVHRFSIDGTAVQGFSGGPVVMQKGGKIFLIGVLQSQVTSKSLDEAKSTLNRLNTGSWEGAKIQEVFRALRDNLSTGIVSAVDIKHCYELIDWEKAEKDPLIGRKIQDILDRVMYGEISIGVKPRNIKNLLKNKGYTLEQGSNHEIWKKEGADSITVSRSGKKDIANGTALSILKSIAKAQYNDESSSDHAEYLKKLKSEVGF